MTDQGRVDDTQRLESDAREHDARGAGPAEESAELDAQTDGRREHLAALEAVLFMAAEPLPAREIAEILDVAPDEAEEIARELESQYEGRGIQVTRVAGGYQVCTRPEYGPYVAKLHKPERFRLSRAALETLAIVAYKQPVTRPEVEAIRGVNSDSPLDTLLQYELICEAGRKDAPGRPVLYRTTENFLGKFGLNSVDDLPRLDSIPADEADARAEAKRSLEPRETTGARGESDAGAEDEQAAGDPGETAETERQSEG